MPSIDTLIQEQYASQCTILETAGILETFTATDGEQAGKKGIRGINGKAYPIPTLEDINRRMLEKREHLEKKIAQGFTKMILVPFAMPLDALFERYRAALQRHFDTVNLLFTKQEPTEPDQPITKLHPDGPLLVWDQYNNADINDMLIYNPQEFSENHKGQTKQDIIATNGEWKILLFEDMPNIPREGLAKTRGGRTQIDTHGTQIRSHMPADQTVPTPNEYLAALLVESQNTASPYFQELCLMPEDQVMYALTHLEETHQVIDDWQDYGSISWLLGAYFPTSMRIPIFYWRHDDGQGYFSWGDRGHRHDNYGLRSAVAV